MKRRISEMTAILLIITIIFTGCSAKAQTQAQTGDTEQQTGTATVLTSSEVVVDTEFSARDLEVGYEDSTATHIQLKESSVEVSGSGASVNGTTVTISAEGSYIISGTLADGQILVDAGDSDKIQLVFAGVNITNADQAPVYIKNADKVFLTLQEGTDNSLTDGNEYVQIDDNNVDGVIYSKADLTLNGTGTLTIAANYKHGIVSKDDLVITGGTYDITAVKDALNGKDCVKIKDGTFTLSSTQGNGIQSKNEDDSTRGYVYINGGNITVTNCQEGIEGTVIMIAGGEIAITSQDDGLNAASASTATETQTVPDMQEAPDVQTVPGTQTTPNTQTAPDISSAEKLSAGTDATAPSDITSGTTADNAANGSTDAASGAAADENAAGWKPGNSMPVNGVPNDGMGRGGFGGDMANNTNCYIEISGGTITINAEGDGIDSNGSLKITGGTIYIYGPTMSGNGSLDYNGTGEITGGTVMAAGSTGMAMSFSDTSTQYSILYNLSTAVEANQVVTLTDTDGNKLVSFVPSKNYQSVVISSPDLKQGATYQLTCGDQSYEVTLSSISTSAGEQGTGGFGQGGGGFGQREMGGQGRTDRGKTSDSNSSGN